MIIEKFCKKKWFNPVAARDHFERVSCKLYKNIWALKINFVGKFNYDKKVQL